MVMCVGKMEAVKMEALMMEKESAGTCTIRGLTFARAFRDKRAHSNTATLIPNGACQMTINLKAYSVDTHVCHGKGCYIVNRKIEKDENGVPFCPRCGGHAIASGERLPEWLGVAVFERGQQYGGPEEGGWWYDTGVRLDETIRCFPAGDAPQVELYMDRLRSQYNKKDFVVKLLSEMVPPKRFPEERPYYE